MIYKDPKGENASELRLFILRNKSGDDRALQENADDRPIDFPSPEIFFHHLSVLEKISDNDHQLSIESLNFFSFVIENKEKFPINLEIQKFVLPILNLAFLYIEKDASADTIVLSASALHLISEILLSASDLIIITEELNLKLKEILFLTVQNYLPSFAVCKSVIIELLKIINILFNLNKKDIQMITNLVDFFKVLLTNSTDFDVINCVYKCLNNIYDLNFNVYEMFLNNGFVELSFFHFSHYIELLNESSTFIAKYCKNVQNIFQKFPPDFPNVFQNIICCAPDDSMSIKTLKLISELSCMSEFADIMINNDGFVTSCLLALQDRSFGVQREALKLLSNFLTYNYQTIEQKLSDLTTLDFFVDYIETNDQQIILSILSGIILITEACNKANLIEPTPLFKSLLMTEQLLNKICQMRYDDTYMDSIQESAFLVYENCNATIKRFQIPFHLEDEGDNDNYDQAEDCY